MSASLDTSENRPDGLLQQLSGVSLARRLLLGAAAWGLIVLIGGAIALSAIYSAQTVQLLEEDLDSEVKRLVREVVYVDDRLVTDDSASIFVGDSRYETALSGRYWAVIDVEDDGTRGGDLRSESLWDGDVPLSDEDMVAALSSPGTTVFSNSTGPNDEALRVAAIAISLENRAMPIVMLTAADRTPSNEAAKQFRNMLIATMVALFGGVFAAMFAAVRYSLQPLGRISQDIADIREGEKTQLADDYPSEVTPLTRELNQLLEHNRSVVDRARTHVGNLAHALKTPIAVLRNEAAGSSQLDDVVRRQTDSMHKSVEHYLKRARAAARAEVLGARTEIVPALSGLLRLFDRLHADKYIELTGSKNAVFRGESQDFEEMMGNLLDNACKWATENILITITGDGIKAGVEITVDDDGPGLTPEERKGALQRGIRLDETTPGTGLGLSIVTEITELHGGELSLDRAPLGGLRVKLTFPGL